MSPTHQKDLVILCADKNMEYTLRGILARPAALGLKSFDYDLFVHPEHDPGCLNRGHDFLNLYAQSHAHALLLFDHEGCGRHSELAEILEAEVETRLAPQGWAGCAAIVITPELENWVWSDSPHVDATLGWEGKTPPLRQWLEQRGDWPAGKIKPPRPKEAVEAALRTARKQRSSALYQDLAGKVSFNRCSDRAFVKLKSSLQAWFAR